jgi:O-acetyl-ADP-ribose deacetylase (regulator of RNase III)
LPVKEFFWNPSKLEWVEAGLKALALFLETEKIESVGLPAIGQGSSLLHPN